ncbi:glycine oxidase ThiO [Corynebacterium renale]|uniref:glycine oxidase n=1 Tax=Corynebacterium renale TaxID=1724 RepID=A0A2A9DMG9_9CORY|nr:glycine oxidase ThiO [Corynebacterium renale]PFG27793.1 glycine oxidase [Corynebacterium renale]SQI22088.1 amino acid oxidase flavoprotein ThiO [Corynebacterium renale]
MLLERSFPHVIVGAGIIGLSTAFELFSRGVPATDIAIIDPAPRSGATFAAGGMLAPCAEVQYKQEPLYPLMVESARLYPDLITRLQEYTDQDLGYRTESTFVVAADRADATHLKELTTHQQGHLFEVERLTLRQARAKEPALHPQLAGVVEIPGDHQINPRMYSAALLAVLQERGVAFVEKQATALNREDGRVTSVECGDLRVDVSDTAYLCNGLGAAQVTGWYPGEKNPLQLRPVRGDMLRLRVPEGQEPPVGRVIRGFVEDRPIYIIPRTDGTIAVGATSREDARRGPAVDGVFTLLRDAIRIVPGLEDCEFIEAITGDRPGTPDDMPYLALWGENLVISTGYFRHGILLSALGAHVGADLGLNRTTEYTEALWTSQ